MTDYWKKKIVESHICENCGGELKKKKSVPVAKGYIMEFECIRCSTVGYLKDKLYRENKLTKIRRVK